VSQRLLFRDHKVNGVDFGCCVIFGLVVLWGGSQEFTPNTKEILFEISLPSPAPSFIFESRSKTRLIISGDRVKLPSDPSRTVKGVDVLPFVMSPLMGPEEYDMDVSRLDSLQMVMR
jgi:hypothetical protein